MPLNNKQTFDSEEIIAIESFFLNGISTFVGYLMPKLFSLKNNNGTI